MDIEEIQNEARKGYDLRARLAESNSRTKTVTVYTDANLGAELGYATDEEVYAGIKSGRRIRKGLIGELDALKEQAAALEGDEGATQDDVDEIHKRAKSIGAKIAKVRKEMEQTAFVFTLRSVPEAVIKDCRRKARKSLGIKGKGIPEGREEEYADEYTFHMLAASVQSWEDKKTGDTFDAVTVDQARDLQGFLPRGQFQRLDEAMVELSLEVAIANSAVDDADF